jgi:hypothetical protein
MTRFDGPVITRRDRSKDAVFRLGRKSILTASRRAPLATSPKPEVSLLFPANRGTRASPQAGLMHESAEYQSLRTNCSRNGNSQAPPISREKWSRVALIASVDSCSFAMRFAFVLAAASPKPPQQPKRRGVLGSYTQWLSKINREQISLLSRITGRRQSGKPKPETRFAARPRARSYRISILSRPKASGTGRNGAILARSLGTKYLI